MTSDPPSRSLLSVVFTDVTRSTDLRVRTGDDAADVVLERFRSLSVEVFERHGGREVQWLGDGSLCLFQSPRAAVAAALELQDRARNTSSLPIFRVGINCGEVLVKGGDVSGQAVHAAARLVAEAAPGSVVASGVVRELVGAVPGVRFRNAGQVALRGFVDPITLFEVEPLDTPHTLDRASATAGRVRELERIERALAQARRGEGGVATISGEAGIGKSRLVEETQRRAAASGTDVYVGSCSDDSMAPPYEPFAEVLGAVAAAAARSDVLHRSLRPLIGEVARIAPAITRFFPDAVTARDIPVAQESRFLYELVVDVLATAAEVNPAVVVIEDAHWADEETLRLLEFVVRRAPKRPFGVLVTHRDSDIAVPAAFERFLEAVARSGRGDQIDLAPLSRPDVADMLYGLLGEEAPDDLVAYVASASDGNPFFIEEVTRYLAEEGRVAASVPFTAASLTEHQVPRSLRLIMDRRLDRVPQKVRTVLEAAAIVGRDFELRVTAQLAGPEADELLGPLEEAAEMHLVYPLEGERDAFRFKHELTRQTLLAGLSPPARRRLHLAAAQALEEDPAAAPSTLAYHYEQAGEVAVPAKVAGALLRAGLAAIEAASFREAVRLLERALPLLPPGDVAARADCLSALGTARRGVGDISGALPLWREAAEIYEQLGRGEEAGVVWTGMAVELGWTMRWVEVWEVMQRAIAAFGDTVSVESLRLKGYHALLLSFAGDPAGAEKQIAEVTELHNRHLPDERRGGEQGLWAIHFYNYQRLRECVDAAYKAIPAMRRAGELWALVNMLTFVQDALSHLGRFDEADNITAEIAELGARVGSTGAVTFSKRITAGIDFLRSGDLVALEAILHEDVEQTEADPDRPSPGVGYTWLSIVKFLQGNWDDSVPLAERGVELDMLGVIGGTPQGWLALLHAYRGEDERARALIDAKWNEVPRPGHPSGFASWHMSTLFVEALIVLGDRDRAGSLYPVVAELLELGCVHRDFDGRVTQTVAGLAAACAGDVSAAEAHLREAESLIDRLELPLERAELARLRAMVLPGDRVALEEAAAWYATNGMPRHVNLVEALIERDQADPGTGDAGDAVMLRSEGEYWAVSLGSDLVRVRGTKGLRYLHRLVAEPGREWPVLDLVAAVEGTPQREIVREAGLEVLDEQAKKAYRKRIAELEGEIEEAREFHDPGRVEKPQLELVELLQQLSGAVGLGGRSRSTGGATERARVNVTKVIRGAIRRIAAQDPEIGTHLEQAVTTGTTCSYRPLPE